MSGVGAKKREGSGQPPGSPSRVARAWLAPQRCLPPVKPCAKERWGRWPEGRGQGVLPTANLSGVLGGGGGAGKGVDGKGRGCTTPATGLDPPRCGREAGCVPRPGALRSASLGCSAQRMECARAASGGGQAGAEVPMEPLGSQVPEVEQPQVPAGERGPGSPASSPISARAAKEAAGAGQDLSGGRKLPSPRPALLRVPPPSLGYGAFRRQTSSGPEPPSPGPSAAEQSRDGEAPGAELAPWAAQGEPAPGAWAPMELQVDVRVKPVGAAGGSRAPSPAPSTRFLTVPVPESPGFSRHTSPAYPLLSPGGTWGRAAPLAPARAERGHDAEGRASPAEGRAESPGSPTCRCRCRELGLEKREDAVLLPRADADCDWKLPRAVTLVGKCARRPEPTPPGVPRSLRTSPPPLPPGTGPLGSGGTRGPRQPSRCPHPTWPVWLRISNILAYVIVIQIICGKRIQPLFLRPTSLKNSHVLSARSIFEK